MKDTQDMSDDVRAFVFRLLRSQGISENVDGEPDYGRIDAALVAKRVEDAFLDAINDLENNLNNDYAPGGRP